MASTTQLPPSASAIYIGRQPIYDRDLNVIAYELLYRSDEQSNWAEVTDDEHATTNVLNTAFMEIGFDDLVGDNKAFINMPRGFLISEQPLSLPSGKVVLELLEDIEVDDEVIKAVRALSQYGFTIALDDFVFHEKLIPLVQLANIIKIDLMELTDQALVQHVELLKGHNVRLLAEKVETQEQFELCKRLGFDYFQGYYFSRPQIISGSKMPADRLAILQLLARIYDPEMTFEELDLLISQDDELSSRILRVINFAANSLPRKVSTMKQALSFLGLKIIRNWISMVSFSDIENKPRELIRNAMIRARMCECMAQSAGFRNSDASFTVGLFSALDSIMDRPLSVLVTTMPFSVEIKQALLEQEGDLGEMLKCVQAYEMGDWEHVDACDLTPQQIRRAYVDALHWVNEINRQIA